MKARTVMLCFLAYGLVVGSLNYVGYEPSAYLNLPTWYVAKHGEGIIREHYEGKLEKAFPAIRETRELMGDIREEDRKPTQEEQERLIELKEEVKSQREVYDGITGEMSTAMSRYLSFFISWKLIPTSALIWGLIGLPVWLVQRYREARRGYER